MHCLALLCFQKYSLWFSSTAVAKSKEIGVNLIDIKEMGEILKSTFDLMAQGDENPSLKPLNENETPIIATQKVKDELPEPNLSPSFQLSLPLQEPLLKSAPTVAFSLPNHSLNLLDHLPKDLIVPEMPKPMHPLFVPTRATSSFTLSRKLPTFDEAPSDSPHFRSRLNLELSHDPSLTKAPSIIPFPDLFKLPTLDELETSSYSESFDADLVFLPKEDNTGYLFALTLIPRPDLDLPRLNQHITFLIDRSNSIQQGRLSACKSAVHKALEELNPKDTFNIIAFDSKTEKMSPHYLSCSGPSYARAEAFLEQIQLGSFFSTSDLYKPLFLTVPGQIQQDEVYTAILLTDGENLGKRTTQRALLADWTSYNDGKVSLFAIGMNDPHIGTLDALAALNKGKFINTSTKRGMKRRLLKLLKNIQNPVAKDISCFAISKSPQVQIVLFPTSHQMSNLYLDQPFVILGEADALDDFILFVQGKVKGRWLNVKKSVSFLNAKKGNISLKEEIALQRAYQLYEQYMIDENPKHIVDAKLLLEPYQFQVALQ